MVRSRNAVLALMGLVLLTTACRRTPPPPAAAPAQPGQATAQPAPTSPAADPDASRRAEEERARGVLAERVYFDYDDASLRADSRQTLDVKVPLLRQYPGFTLTIEGHADERGSTEYNLALGTRRAATVRDYLVGFGLESRRFRTISYGEERPLAQGSGESAWSQNRRAEFRVDGTIPGGAERR